MKNFNTLLLFISLIYNFGLFSQDSDIKLSVTVKDDKNKAIPGAIILIDGVKQQRVANSKGIFRIKLENVPKTITAFSPLVGIKKVIYVNGNNNVTIKILKGKEELDIVTDINEKSLSTVQFATIYDYLEGAVAGVNVENTTITIRGYNTINGSMEPLFILNGVQVSKDVFSQIVPLQIKKIYILKGNETSIYGARGANGVIVVETK